VREDRDTSDELDVELGFEPAVPVTGAESRRDDEPRAQRRRSGLRRKLSAVAVLAFIFFMIRTTLSRFTPAQATAAIVVSYYWHFVDIVWIGLFSVIYIVQ
jgi:hypothetical protein